MTTQDTFEPPKKSFWLFAYGSLMWNPDFPYSEKILTRVSGYHRALCIYSWEYRGTEKNPGLVFGLEPGGSVKGMAFRIRAKDAEAVYKKVYAREMTTAVYRQKWCKCHLSKTDRQPIDALTFIAARGHPQYAGKLSLSAVIQRVKEGKGRSGYCADYVLNTLKHLELLGVSNRTNAELIRCLRK